jgi:hypothetical protein
MTRAPPCLPIPGRDHRIFLQPPLPGMTTPAPRLVGNPREELQPLFGAPDLGGLRDEGRRFVDREHAPSIRQRRILGKVAARKTCLWGLTFELSGRRRRDAKARAVKMHDVPQAGPWWHAVGAPLERVVRAHSF